MYYVRQIPEATLPWSCACADLPPDPMAPDLPCPSCCAWTKDLVDAIEARSSDDRRAMHAENQRVAELVRVHVPDLEWPDEIDAAFYHRFVARLRIRETNRAIPEFDPNTIWAHAGELHRIAICRHALTEAGIDWRTELLSVLPLTYYEHCLREADWATVAELMAVPAVFDMPKKDREDFDASVLWGLLCMNANISIEGEYFSVGSHELGDLLAAINEAGQEKIRGQILAHMEVVYIKWAGDWRMPLKVGFVYARTTPTATTPLLVFAVYGKDGDRSKALVLDKGKLASTIALALGELLAWAPATLVREHWGQDPSVGFAKDWSVRFCSGGLLREEEDGNTTRWLVEAVARANP